LFARLGLRAGGQHPAPAWLAPAPAAPLSNTATAASRAARRQAMPSPMTPAPMMATVGLLALTERRFGNRRLPSLE
jgi:hypothetical protein